MNIILVEKSYFVSLLKPIEANFHYKNFMHVSEKTEHLVKLVKKL